MGGEALKAPPPAASGAAGGLGERVQMDTSVHGWLEERSDVEIVLIAMMDDATSRLLARFACSVTPSLTRLADANFYDPGVL